MSTDGNLEDAAAVVAEAVNVCGGWSASLIPYRDMIFIYII